MTSQDPKHIHISDYNYPLPDERIAKFPLPVRDQSKLPVRRGAVFTRGVGAHERCLFGGRESDFAYRIGDKTIVL